MRRRKEHRQVFELIKSSDIVLEVVDGRLPLLTRVSSIENHLEKLKLPLIIVLNKCDLVPRDVCERTKNSFNQEFPTVYISAQNRLGTKILRQKNSTALTKESGDFCFDSRYSQHWEKHSTEYFERKARCSNWFESGSHKTFTNCTYIKKNRYL